MVSALRNITINSLNPFELATFWSTVLGLPLNDDDFPGDPEAVIHLDEHQVLLFVTVPEAKATRNRIHFDVQPTDRTRDEEVARLLGLGAVQIDDRRRPDGSGWVVMSDPEGNEFCVERSQAEKA
ncbi:glyoxalase [Longispora fulva]|uniref:Catechol 2,3-dioxygenase-like lactoylglutathione lyase family enzyme n=1 Tax=Longispora fulva TaxID=619741 RepID=A0A8J7KKE5_9ACTN|nr:VOC family protein [Longispora fulva]MBG6138004.1 catechol 2,3-dioxygenase-like lactoylglutathione lyase family enzyme [Longispora fulva]GIG60257.1 glyoxalase [Longispora fulva]